MTCKRRMQHVGRIKGQWHAQAIDDLKKKIKERFTWNMAGNWSYSQLQLIYQAGLDIENYVDRLTGGKGQAWMNTYMGGLDIAWTGADQGSSMFGNIKLPSWLAGKDGNSQKQYLAHELAHAWDENTGHYGFAFFGNPLAGGTPVPVGAVDGPADHLNTYIGGTVVSENACRFCNRTGRGYIPDAFEYREPAGPNSYGNNSTADYLADSFSYSVYSAEYPDYVPNPTVTTWINSYIAIQASYLP